MNATIKNLHSGVRPWPVFMGVLIDIVLTIIFITATFPLYFPPNAETLSEQEYNQMLIDITANNNYTIAVVALSALATVLATFIIGCRTKSLEIKHALWIVLVGSLIFLFLPADPTSKAPTWADIVSWALVLPTALLGGYLAKAWNSRSPNK